MDNRNENNKEKKQRSGWIRMFEIAVRTGHIGTTGILFGAAIFAVPFARFLLWHQLAIASGIVLTILAICQSRHWFYQVRGVMAITHVGLLGLVHYNPELRVPILTLVLVLGVFGSHMPGGIRHWSLVHGRRID